MDASDPADLAVIHDRAGERLYRELRSHGVEATVTATTGGITVDLGYLETCYLLVALQDARLHTPLREDP